jgi:hypothetical protein
MSPIEDRRKTEALSGAGRTRRFSSRPHGAKEQRRPTPRRKSQVSAKQELPRPRPHVPSPWISPPGRPMTTLPIEHLPAIPCDLEPVGSGHPLADEAAHRRPESPAYFGQDHGFGIGGRSGYRWPAALWPNNSPAPSVWSASNPATTPTPSGDRLGPTAGAGEVQIGTLGRAFPKNTVFRFTNG